MGHGFSQTTRTKSVVISENPWQVIAASAVGTMIEWYDSFLNLS
jgi:hypothetical protein